MPEPRLPTDEERSASKLHAERLASVLREMGHQARLVELTWAWFVMIEIPMVGFEEEGAG